MEVVSLDPDGHVAMPLDDLGAVQLGDLVTLAEEMATIPVGPALLGKVVDSMCVSYEEHRVLPLKEHYPLYGKSFNPMQRCLITQPLDLGIRAVNACLTCGKGQRQGIFAGCGRGKKRSIGNDGPIHLCRCCGDRTYR